MTERNILVRVVNTTAEIQTAYLEEISKCIRCGSVCKPWSRSPEYIDIPRHYDDKTQKQTKIL